MSRRVSIARFVGCMALGLCVLATTEAQAASGNGPYYAEPAWDQKLQTTTRFVVLTDWNSKAVLDRETGLVWEQSPSTEKMDWFFARVRCASDGIGGRGGWRLPALAELSSLVDKTATFPNPTLPPGHPFANVQSVSYWSATTVAETPTDAWHVFFLGGDRLSNHKAINFRVWCVRGAMNEAVY